MVDLLCRDRGYVRATRRAVRYRPTRRKAGGVGVITTVSTHQRGTQRDICNGGRWARHHKAGNADLPTLMGRNG